MTVKSPTKYLIVWYDRRQKPRKKRRFSFTVKIVPDKYKTNHVTMMTWAKRYLSQKYEIPVDKVNIEEFYGGMRK